MSQESFNPICAKELFFGSQILPEEETQHIVKQSLSGLEDGELYLEYRAFENLVFDDRCLKQAGFTTNKGFGLRGVIGESTGFAHSSDLSLASLKRAGESVQAVKNGYTGDYTLQPPPPRTNRHLYGDYNPIDQASFAHKIGLLQQIDAHLRSYPSVVQVTVSLTSEWQVVGILRSDRQFNQDIRPLVRLSIGVVVEKDGKKERGSFGAGGRASIDDYINDIAWQDYANCALNQAMTNLDARPAPAGEMPVVLGPGWPGILLHEAVGHGLEGDFNRKQTSAFAGLLGKRVASKGVTVVDDGTLHQRRGSLSIDDEGTPTTRTILIEDGILCGYMQDRLNARLMGVTPTGNGRRESYAHQPLPRMTNTIMEPGNADPASIIASVNNGIYAVNFSGGQVDITSGKFVFSASEAYRIENGKVTHPIKGATLIGNGPDALTRIQAIGNDLQLDPGIGTCGKAGQAVPVGVGQPTLLLERMTIGGTTTS